MLSVEAQSRRASEQTAITAIRSGDESAFAELVEPYRRQLHVHCYRMLGSVDDADDALQETLLRAWRALAKFEGRALLRTWMYRIATNVCLDMLERRRRRVMPPDLGPPSADLPIAVEASDEVPWLQPYPDHLLEPAAPPGQEPDAIVVRRETIELTYLAAIQHLPPRQRAVFILRESLGWSARETADLIDASIASINSALQRARATLRERLPERRADWTAPRAVTDDERALLARYMHATEHADAAGLTALLAEDARQTMPPVPLWLSGRDAISAMAQWYFEREPLGDWRAVPVGANLQPAAAFYLRASGESVFRLRVLDVLTIRNGAIVQIDTFSGSLIRAFGLEPTLPA